MDVAFVKVRFDLLWSPISEPAARGYRSTMPRSASCAARLGMGPVSTARRLAARVRGHDDVVGALGWELAQILRTVGTSH